MGVRQREWARKETDRLREVLGGVCDTCGTVEDLEFDCLIPMGHEHHAIEWSARISFYRAMHAAGNLGLKCKRCNARKGNGPTLTTAYHKRRLAAVLLDLAWPVPPENTPIIQPGPPDQSGL